MRCLGYTKDDSEDIFAVVDGDNSGSITVVEFMKWYMRLCEKAEAAAARLKDHEEEDEEDDGGSQSDDNEDVDAISPSEISSKKTAERSHLLSGISEQLCRFDPHQYWQLPT